MHVLLLLHVSMMHVLLLLVSMQGRRMNLRKLFRLGQGKEITIRTKPKVEGGPDPVAATVCLPPAAVSSPNHLPRPPPRALSLSFPSPPLPL
jgi:hypothetical protein